MCVGICFGLINTVTTHIMNIYFGQNTEQKVKKGFENAINGDYNCFILGNSKMYRGINPERITKYKAFNFAHDNDTYNQVYYKLLYLAKNDVKVDALIIGTDYNCFSYMSDSRNYIYDRLFGFDYMRDYNKSVIGEVATAIGRYGKIQGENLFITILDIPKVYNENRPIDYMKENGQFVTHGEAKVDDTVERDGTIMDIQMEYFDKIIGKCLERGIELYVVVPPSRDVELESYGFTAEQFEEFDSMIKSHLSDKYSNNYYNYSNLQEFKDMSNYVDVAHLNSEAADRFTTYLDNEVLLVR